MSDTDIVVKNTFELLLKVDESISVISRRFSLVLCALHPRKRKPSMNKSCTKNEIKVTKPQSEENYQRAYM